MARDIRSFFESAVPAAKRQKRSADAQDTKSSDEPLVSKKDAAIEAETTVEADAATNEAIDDEAEELTSDIESFKQLETNLKALMGASWFDQLHKQFTQSYFRSLVAFLIKEELAYVALWL